MNDKHTPDVAALKEAHRFHARTIFDSRRAERGDCPLTAEELSEEFERAIAKFKADAIRKAALHLRAGVGQYDKFFTYADTVETGDVRE